MPARKKLLFLTHAALYKHPSLAPAEAAVTEYGKTGGFDVTTLEGYKQESAKLDLSFLTPEYLAQFDGLMLMTNGNLPLTDAQKRAIVDYVRNGKALVGVHCASLTLYDYPEFGEVLGGYYRRSIIPTTIVGQKMGVLKVEDPSHPATKMLGGSWPVAEEFYQFGTAVWDASRPTEQISQVGRLHIPMAFSRDRVHVLLSLDTEKTGSQRSRAGGREGRRLPAGLVAHVRQRAIVLHVARPPRRHLVDGRQVPRARHRRHPLGARTRELIARTRRR